MSGRTECHLISRLCEACKDDSGDPKLQLPHVMRPSHERARYVVEDRAGSALHERQRDARAVAAKMLTLKCELWHKYNDNLQVPVSMLMALHPSSLLLKWEIERSQGRCRYHKENKDANRWYQNTGSLRWNDPRLPL